MYSLVKGGADRSIALLLFVEGKTDAVVPALFKDGRSNSLSSDDSAADEFGG